MEKENQEKIRQEKLEKERKEKEKDKNNLKNNQNYIRNPNQNKYEAPKRLSMCEPYQIKYELPPPPKVQAPRQVLELERLKGRSKLPEIERASSFNRKKFGLANLDIVEPGELVSNIKLRLINQMLIRQQSDFGSNSKSSNTNKNEKSLNLLTSFSNKKYDSDNEETKEKKIQIKKKLANIIKNINNKKIKSKIGLFFKKWKNPSKYIKNMPSVKGINIMDCAPPPRLEKRNSATSVLFLSKSLGKDAKPFLLENEKNNNNNKNEKKLINIERVNIEKRQSKSPDINKKDFKPQRILNGGRIEFVLPNQREISNDNKIENTKKDDKIKTHNEEEEEEEEEIEEEEDNEISNKKNKNNHSKNIIRFESKSSYSSKNEAQITNKNNLIKKKENNADLKDKDIIENDINNCSNNKKFDEGEDNLINESKEKKKLFSSELFKINKLGNRAKNNVVNLLRNIPDPLFEDVNPGIFINFSKIYFKNCAAYHIFSLYSLFNKNNEFYDKRAILYKWKKIINKDSNIYNNKTKFDYYDCESIGHCRGCACFRQEDIQSKIKKILIKYILMKDYNPVKYYLYLWYKKTFMEKKIE